MTGWRRASRRRITWDDEKFLCRRRHFIGIRSMKISTDSVGLRGSTCNLAAWNFLLDRKTLEFLHPCVIPFIEIQVWKDQQKGPLQRGKWNEPRSVLPPSDPVSFFLFLSPTLSLPLDKTDPHSIAGNDSSSASLRRCRALIRKTRGWHAELRASIPGRARSYSAEKKKKNGGKRKKEGREKEETRTPRAVITIN